MTKHETPKPSQAAPGEIEETPSGYRPWEDRSLPAEERFEAYKAHVSEQVLALGRAAEKLGTAEELRQFEESPETQRLFAHAEGLSKMTAGEFCSRIDGGLLAHDMVGSYTFDKETGVSTFTVPAGVTDVEAMKALNEYFRKNFPRFDRDAVCADGLEWFENLPEYFPTHCEQRDYSQARQITITGVVKGTVGENRTTQGNVLRNDSLVFSDPRDQAIAAALHACKHYGQDLFKDLWVRGSVPGFTLGTGRHRGVLVDRNGDGLSLSVVAASGSPSPELK